MTARIIPFREPLRQQLIRSVAQEAGPRLVGETAADWLIRIGPHARKLNQESEKDSAA